MTTEENKAAFLAIEYHWHTIRHGFMRQMEMPAKNEIERIYKEEIEPNFLPNKVCGSCYMDAVKVLINHFKV